MADKKDSFIEYELEFLDLKLAELKAYIEDTPFSKLKDRMMMRGKVKVCVATKEAQRKDLTQALKDYAEILRTVDIMRTREDKKKIAVRGDQDLGSQAKQYLDKRQKA
jgi:transcriptional regulator of heat shock response